MLWRKRYKNRLIVPVAGFLLSVFWFELAHVFISPALFPSWLDRAEAATGVIDPNGDVGTNTGTRTSCAGTLYFDCLNDLVRDPTVPTTAVDFIEYAGGNQTNSEMSTLTGVATATAVAVKVYHQETSTNMTLSVSLVNSAGTVIAGPTNVANRAAHQWDTINFTSLSLSQANVDGLRVRLSCARAGGPQSNSCRVFSMYSNVTYDPVINVTVSSTGNQRNVVASATNSYVGGAFSIVGNAGGRNITSITINEAGTIHAQNNLKNIRLFYDLATTTPFTCSTVSYNGNEPQFGSTAAGGFSGSNGSATFTGSVGISPTATMCVYVVVDVQSGAVAGETIEVQITNPTTDVVGSGSPVISPDTLVAIAGTTVVEKQLIDQINYHWRNNDGISVTDGNENTLYTDFPKNTTMRLRLAVSNEGTATSTAQQFRLEYAGKVTTCAAATGWTNVGNSGGLFSMSNSVNMTDGNNTINILEANGGVSDPNDVFLTPNAGERDINSQTGNLTLSPLNFVELEYGISATSTLSDGDVFCFRVTNAGTPLDNYTRYAETSIGADINITTIGNQVEQLLTSSTNQYVGGTFGIVSTGDSYTISSVTITATGTANIEADFSNVRLYYDLDTSNPYNCSSENFSDVSTENQFGSTVSAFNNTFQATFSGSLNITSTQSVCLYVVLNVSEDINNGDTFEVLILSPSSDVNAGAASLAPNAAVQISGTTILAKAALEQTGYHWRNNNGAEDEASSATGGIQNTIIPDAGKEVTYRLRLAVANEGLATSSAVAYRLEWAQKLSTCNDIVSWTRIDAGGDAWQMLPTANLTDGGNTTNIDPAIGGVSDPNSEFLVSNAGVKDNNDTTASVSLSPIQFIELEYAILATNNAVQGASYCFRVTNAGTPLDLYTQYPEIKIKLDTDFKIQRGFVTLAAGSTTASINAGQQYDAPSSNSAAFLRITNTHHTGGGPNTTGNRNANDITVYISGPNNLTTGATFARTSSGVDTRVYWEIVEYRGVPGGENEIIVRQANTLSYLAGSDTVTSAAISGISSSTKVVVFVTGQHNQDAGRNNYGAGLSTALLNTGTNQVQLTRGATGVISDVSYAAVEFTGSNWKTQRTSLTYSAVGATTTQAIAAVNNLSRTFLHTQKRLSGTNISHADFGHEVWLSSIGQLSFILDAQAANPTNHTSVAWVIENTQNSGSRMIVTRDNGLLPTSGTGNQSNFRSIGKTLTDVTNTSLFANNRSDETSRSWPDPILGISLASSTSYLIWRSDASANINFRTEIVEWPTAVRKIEQNNYRLYVNNSALTPSDPWPTGFSDLGENEEMTSADSPMTFGDVVRIRMNIQVNSAAMPASLDSFKLQYTPRVNTCSTDSDWIDLGEIGSTTAIWRGFDNPVSNGTPLSTNPPSGGDLLITSASPIAGTYQEENPSELNPYLAFPGDEVEYDWVIQHNGADNKSSYCFRMVEATSETFQQYNNYPVIRTAGYEPLVTNWRWYGDATSSTPTVPLSLEENIAPNNIPNQSEIKLRVVLRESSGAAGVNTKFALQFSETPDFSTEVVTLTATSSCLENSLWCYADGAGFDNATITTAVVSNADSCVGGVGSGCGTHNESDDSATATLDQLAYSNTEFEFTIKHAGARVGAVYYFRPYDVVNDEPVALYATSTYPSLVTEGAKLFLSTEGLPSGTTTAGVTTNISTSPNEISFSPMSFNTDYIAAHRIIVDTNSTEGYKVLKYAQQQLLNSYGHQIESIPTTNASPAGWNSSCLSSAPSCVGYHTTDAVLDSGSTRFAPTDSYAGISTVPVEVMFSPVPTRDTYDIVYRIKVTQNQPAGKYDTNITYIVIPVF